MKAHHHLLPTTLTLLTATAFLAAAPASQPGTRPTTETPQAELERLRRENADLKHRLELAQAELDKLKKPAPAATQKATAPASIPQDGPGTYKISAGPNGRFTTTVKAKSREDAITIGLKTVAKTAMDYDENVNINELKVERIGP